MESEKKQELVIDGNSFYEIDLKCLKEKKQKQEEAEKRQQKRCNDSCWIIILLLLLCGNGCGCNNCC